MVSKAKVWITTIYSSDHPYQHDKQPAVNGKRLVACLIDQMQSTGCPQGLHPPGYSNLCKYLLNFKSTVRSEVTRLQPALHLKAVHICHEAFSFRACDFLRVPSYDDTVTPLSQCLRCLCCHRACPSKNKVELSLHIGYQPGNLPFSIVDQGYIGWIYKRPQITMDNQPISITIDRSLEIKIWTKKYISIPQPSVGKRHYF